LVLTRNAADSTEVTHFKITGITNGNLFQNDSTTAIANGAFITFAEGNAGLKFTPTGGGNGSFTAQASLSNIDGGLGGSTVNATITTDSGGGGGGGGTTPPPVINDGDNIPPATENSVPPLPSTGNNTVVPGDGNGDGIADSQQASVTSAPFRNTDTITSNPNAPVAYVTLTADTQAGLPDTGDGNTATLTNIVQLNAPADKPANVDMPLGLISFTANVGTAGTSESFSLFVPDSVQINGYFKQASGGAWVNLASAEYGGQVVTVNGKTRLDFKITDGGIFDNDGKADGVITDPGAAGYLKSINPSDTDSDQFPDALEGANGLKVGLKDNDVFVSNKYFVMQTYRDILFREAEPAGLDYWNAKMEVGMSRTEVASTFLDSSEFQSSAAGISRLYFGGLDRIPDNDGMDFWMAKYQSGTTLNQISDAVVSSAEFQSTYGTLDNAAFVDQLYLNIQGRPAEPAGKTYWVDQLSTGMSRGGVLLGFTESVEYKIAIDTEVSVTLDYIGLLGRTPEQAGYKNWVTAQDAGMPEVTVIGNFLAAEEYHDRFLP
jgi:hypothetical protein